ncbi:DegT/DnrJ/EryC1/StrS family aminotransferase [Butyrivibrio sp. AE2032]|uniref:DegT/DnrJ/EryC1/StrS family aminotransferase n=1 Tax=Butyrivibrio sp. AE2032 TaxID=1458463 RepID=UPI00054DE908|nr:DegT/DnrJ/EryC1/StrS family aminotransferase [Butyrivibrio sp. AE2032]
MQFRDLRKQYELHKSDFDAAIESVLQGTDFIHGKKVVELEKKLAEYVGVKHCITCANGTDALQLALMTWNIGAGDAVFVPDFTFFSSGEVVSTVGAIPVFVDISEETFNINPKKLEQAIKKVKTDGKLVPKVVVAVDLFGQPADYQEIKRICKEYGLLLLEDGAQGFGGRIGTKKVCSFGDISTTSFFPAKPLGCYGDGGAVFTDNDEWAALLRSLCVHGKGEDKYDNVRIGMNSRLDTIQAAVLDVKLGFLDEDLEACDKVAKSYSEKLNGSVGVPEIRNSYFSAWAQYTILLKDSDERDKVMKALKDEGIPSNIYYVKPMHKQCAFVDTLYTVDDYNVTTDICRRCLSLPMHPYLEEDDIRRITDVINEAVK